MFNAYLFKNMKNILLLLFLLLLQYFKTRNSLTIIQLMLIYSSGATLKFSGRFLLVAAQNTQLDSLDKHRIWMNE